MYIGVNDQAKKVSNAYIGINGQAKQISKIYIGDINNKAKLAWQNFNGEIVNINDEKYQNLIFKDLNALVFDYSFGNDVVYTVPKTGIYRLELISSFTQSAPSKVYNNSGMLYGGELNINNITYSLQGYPSRTFTFEAKNCIDQQLTLSFPTEEELMVKGLRLGRGSSYGVQYMHLAKGQRIIMQWYNAKSYEVESTQMKIKISDNADLILGFNGGDSVNKHTFTENWAETSLSPYTDGYNTDPWYNIFDINKYRGKNSAIKLETDGSKFINVDAALSEFIFNDTGNAFNYMLYTQDQYIENADKCNQLGLGADTTMSAVGNYSMGLTLQFSKNYDTVQIIISSSNIVFNPYPGCFRITPASISTED